MHCDWKMVLVGWSRLVEGVMVWHPCLNIPTIHQDCTDRRPRSMQNIWRWQGSGKPTALDSWQKGLLHILYLRWFPMQYGHYSSQWNWTVCILAWSKLSSALPHCDHNTESWIQVLCCSLCASFERAIFLILYCLLSCILLGDDSSGSRFHVKHCIRIQHVRLCFFDYLILKLIERE